MIVRHWFPVIACGITLAFLGSIVVVYAYKTSPAPRAAEVIIPAQSEEEYQSTIRAILTTYASDNDVSTAYDTLIYITHIPTSMKDVHIGLVSAFGKLASGDKEEGGVRLEALRLQYPWLVL